MKRLTKYLYENEPGMDCLKCVRRKTGKCNTSADCAIFAAERLAAIEDILGDDYDLDRLRELVEADREGRCVVLPCKVGSPVWRVYDDCEFPGDCGTKQKCNGCEYRNLFAEEQAFCLSMLSQNGKLERPYYTSLEAAENGDYIPETLDDGTQNLMAVKDVKAVLRRVPAADVAPVVHGHWEGLSQEGACSWSGRCSACGARNDIPHPFVAHYCPNCGAKMDGGENDEN